MKFRRVSDWAEESECGRYTVAAAKVMGLWTFQGWRRPRRRGEPGTLLTRTRLTIAEDAREACRRDVALKARAA